MQQQMVADPGVARRIWVLIEISTSFMVIMTETMANRFTDKETRILRIDTK